MGNNTLLDPRQEMLCVNVRQKDFYESRFEATQETRNCRGCALCLSSERAANKVTNLWTRMRYKLMDIGSSLHVYDELYALHRKWLSSHPIYRGGVPCACPLKHATVLDLGCFAGNMLSVWMAENCANYIGIDLSEQATQFLDGQLRERGLSHARAYREDFLANSFPDNYFDVVYAHAVLHHFKDMTVLLQELYRVLKPGGIVISFDPMMTEPLNRFVRLLYRPLQTDRDWEWPFTRATFRLISQYFEIPAMQGFMGMVKLSFPFQCIPGLGGVGRAIGRWGLAFDKKHAGHFGLPFYQCWMVTLQLRKPDESSVLIPSLLSGQALSGSEPKPLSG